MNFLALQSMPEKRRERTLDELRKLRDLRLDSPQWKHKFYDRMIDDRLDRLNELLG